MKARLFAIFFLLIAAAAVLWETTRPGSEPVQEAASGELAAARDRDSLSAEMPAVLPEGAPPAGEKPAQAAASEVREGPSVTRANRRDTAVSPDGVRKVVVDPIASWDDQPPWPEGPKLFAEVETSTRRYVNLRPDDVGEMPRVRAKSGEKLEIKISIPEGEPGEKIHVELPNGGKFADSDVRGRIYALPDNRTLSFDYLADDARGHCNVKLLHCGHTRSLPVWVGELPEPATADDGF
jgi:hypothetical protein